MNNTRAEETEERGSARDAAFDEPQAAAPQQTATAIAKARRVLLRARAAFVDNTRRRDLHRFAP
jgi:hypothetical protein